MEFGKLSVFLGGYVSGAGCERLGDGLLSVIDNRLLAKLGKAVKIADASSQRKAERETVSAVAIAFEVHNTAPGVHSGTLGIAAGMYSVR